MVKDRGWKKYLHAIDLYNFHYTHTHIHRRSLSVSVSVSPCVFVRTFACSNLLCVLAVCYRRPAVIALSGAFI